MIDYIAHKKIEILFLILLISLQPTKQTKTKNHSNVSNNHDAPGV
jgi:hypothetical protein